MSVFHMVLVLMAHMKAAGLRGGSWKADEVWHCESPGQATDNSAISVVEKTAGFEGIMEKR